MPSNTDMFQQIAGSQPGPFSKYLQPTQPGPMDQPMNAPTGWESKGVAGGEIALGFLKGVRQQRVQQFAQQEAVKQAQYDALRSQINRHVQNDDLEEMTRHDLGQYGDDLQTQHFTAETRKVKGGVGEFFKNLIVNATGGQMQGSTPIDIAEAAAKVHMMATGPTSTKSYWRAQANQKLAEATAAAAASGYPMSQAQVQQHAAQIANDMNLQAHLGQDTNSWIASAALAAPADPTAEAMQRAQMQRLNELRYGSQAPGQAAQPGPGGSASAPILTAPPPTTMGPGHGVSVQMPPMMGAWGSTSAPPGAAPSANIRPADTAPAQPLPLDFRNPVDLQIMHRMGYDVSGIDKPETLYDPNDQTRSRYVTDMVRDPVTHKWVHRNVTDEPIPPEAQSWIPSTQLKISRPDPVTSVTGGYTKDGPFYQGHRNRAGQWEADVDLQGNKVFAPLPTPLTPTVGGGTGEEWGEKKPGTSIPPPRPAPKTAHEMDLDKANAGAQSLLEAAQGDPTWAQEMLPQSKLPDNIKALVRKNLEDDARQKQLEDPTVKVKWMLAARGRAAAKGTSTPPAAHGASSVAPPAAPAKLKRIPDDK
jgi:hypothetical protein